MAEYIEREAAITAIAHRPHVKGWDDYEDGICRGLEEAVNAICAIPAADVVSGSDFRDCRNELCLYCGKYRQKHNGACGGCRWE